MAVAADLVERRPIGRSQARPRTRRAGVAAPGVVGPGDARDLLVGQLAMGPVDQRAQLAGVDEQRLAPPVAEPAVALVAGEEPETDRDLGRVEELARQGDHAVDEVRLDDVLADLALARLVRAHRAVGEDEAGDPGRREVVDEVLDPGEVGVARRRHAVHPALVVPEQLAAPVAVVERRVGEDVVGLEVGVAVVVEGVAVGDLGVDAADGEVHLGQAPGRVVRLLAVDADVADAPGVGLDELLALDEHAAGAAARVVDAALVGGEHLDEHADDVARRVELAALLALGAGELGEEVLVDAAEGVLGAVGRGAERDVATEVDELAEARLVEPGAGVVLGQHALERRVVALDGGHRVVDERADGRLRGAGLEGRPAGLLGHPEDIRGPVLVGVLGVGALRLLGLELGVLGLEGIGDVLEEDQAQDDVLVLGRVHVVAQGVGGLPELRLEAEVRARLPSASRPRSCQESDPHFCR